MSDTTEAWGGWDAAVRDDPFAHFAAARDRCPVHQVRLADGHEAWLVAGHDAARRMLNDRRVSKDMLGALAADGDVVAAGLPGPAFSRHMLNVDPPDHTRLRALVAPAFLPSRIAALEPAIVHLADDLLDALTATGGGRAVDLVGGFARPFPFAVIGELLGIPHDDRGSLADCFRTLLSPWAGDPPPAAVAASDAIVGYLGELVTAKRARPGGDLVSVLLAGSGDDRLTEQELLSSLFQLIVAGHDTTTSLIGNGIVALLDHPDQCQLLGDDPGRIADAVEELVRFSAPVPHATFRVTSEAIELGATEIPARRQVLVCLAAANRDPQVFADADRLDVQRARRAHLGFGHGIHFCLGAPLARLEARVAFTALLSRFPHLRLAVPRSELSWGHGDGLVLRGLDALPVLLTPDISQHTTGATTS